MYFKLLNKVLLLTISFGWLNAYGSGGYIVAGQLKDEFGNPLSTELGVLGIAKNNLMVNLTILDFRHSEEDYLTFNFASHYGIGNKIKAYIGYGGFFGSNKIEFGHRSEDCDDVMKDVSRISCPEPPDFIFGVYPEVGGKIAFEWLQVGVYARYVLIAHQNPDQYPIAGLNIGIGF